MGKGGKDAAKQNAKCSSIIFQEKYYYSAQTQESKDKIIKKLQARFHLSAGEGGGMQTYVRVSRHGGRSPTRF